LDVLGEGVEELALEGGISLGSTEIWWTHPDKLEVQSFQTYGNGTKANHRVACAVRPEGQAHASLTEVRFHGSQLVARTCHPDIALGSLVQDPSGNTFIVDTIEHWIRESGGYDNRVTAVAPLGWGRRRELVPQGTIGPFVAFVTHVDDPQHQGRIRVRLAEDRGRIASPWIARAQPYTGSDTGFHWVPEIDDPVAVIADSSAPESLLCLGALRGPRQQVPELLRHGQNVLKGFATKELALVFDEQARRIVLRTPEATISLDGQGIVTINGKQIVADASAAAKVLGGDTLDLDGKQIRIG
jgi:hypothetical protein